ncbi:MAG TPA: TetR/AcrR family transcriptional regulator [Verrucomicrobiae bacterium]|nr:TetR/AcrR family transcriptional regulator [Verrucomicrobiae bacterium]
MSRPLTSRGAATRRRIVEVAARLTHASGVEATSLDDVCAEAKVSKSQLYHYFADKEALVREVIAAQTERVLAAQEPAIGKLDSAAALRTWADTILALNRSTTAGCPLGSLANELANQSEATRAELVAGFDAWAERLSRGFSVMQSRGELSSSASPRDLAISVLAALQGGLLLAKTAHSPAPLILALKMALRHVDAHRRHSKATPRRA